MLSFIEDSMEKCIAAVLEPWRDGLALHYQWSFDVNVPLEKFDIVVEGANWWEKTLSLKRQLAERVSIYRDNAVELRRVANYFIQVWGGIGRFDKATDVIDQFAEVIGVDLMPNGCRFAFDGISSWSKWLSLACPRWACIYDARVAYSLNVINYVSGGSFKIFPSPEGRNSRLKMIDVSTLLLAGKIAPSDSIEPEALRDRYFWPRKSAYQEYLAIVSRVSKIMWGDAEHLQNIEMLLFALADTFMYEKMIGSITPKRVA